MKTNLKQIVILILFIHFLLHTLSCGDSSVTDDYSAQSNNISGSYKILESNYTSGNCDANQNVRIQTSQPESTITISSNQNQDSNISVSFSESCGIDCSIETSIDFNTVSIFVTESITIANCKMTFNQEYLLIIENDSLSGELNVNINFSGNCGSNKNCSESYELKGTKI